MNLIVSIIALLATVFLLLAAWGLFHQAKLNKAANSTEAVSPFRYSGTLAANTVWVLISLATAQPNFPLLIGCAAMMVGSSTVLLQILQYPPTRPYKVRTMLMLTILICGGIAALGGFYRESLYPVADMLGVLGVGSSFILIHLGTLDQIRINNSRQTVQGLSFPKEVLHFIDWAIWIVYPVLLGLREHWAPFLNACCGFICTILILRQFMKYRSEPRSSRLT